MANSSTCQDCGTALPPGVLNGLCPHCLTSALDMSRILQGTFTSSTPPASTNAETAAQARVLTDTTDYLEPGDRIGVGGMGEVHSARDLKLTRTVAVKRLKPERERQRGAVARFLAEARIAATLEHPGIVPIHDAGIDAEGHPFYTMRLVRGESLGTVMDRLAKGDAETVSRYPLATLLGIFQQVCDAVAYAHSRGVIHRDLKPDNIMLGEFGQVMVMDWGLAKVLEEESKADVASGSTGDSPVPSGDAPDGREEDGSPEAESVSPANRAHVPVGVSPTGAGESPALPSTDGLTQPDVVMGSLGYMAPEQAGGRAYAADPRADVYALGAILYHLLTLRPPIRGRDARLMLDRTTGGDVRPPTDFNRGGPSEVQRLPLLHCPNARIPSALSSVTMKALATRPDDRYPDVSALRADVARWLSGFAVSVENTGLITQFLRLARRHRTLAAVAGLAVLLVAGFAIYNGFIVHRLRSTAPTFARLAESLAREQKLEEALDQISFALRLVPGEAEYLALKGNLLLGLLRIEEARAAFTAAQQSGNADARLAGDLQLCDRLLQQRSADGTCSPESLTELYRTFVLNNRPGEALAIFARLREQRETLFAFWKGRLDQAGIQARLVPEPDGRIKLTVTSPEIRDLAPLASMPLSELSFENCNCLFTDLSPLRGMPLRSINLANSPVSDLRPLAGMQLEVFGAAGCRNLADLTPLRGMNLMYFGLTETAVTDLTPLAGVPMRYVTLNQTKVSFDLSPIANAPIQNLALGNTPFTNLSQLAALPLKYLSLADTPVQDLSGLGGLRLNSIDLRRTRVADLHPLEFMPLDWLVLSGTLIKDISALRGKPLKGIFLHDCAQLRDLSPLAESRDLEELSLPPNHGDIEFLRQLPRLKKLGYVDQPPPAAEFWREYDARKAARK